MRESISTIELRKRLGDVLDRVRLRDDVFVIERRGRPVAMLVPVEGAEKKARKP